MAAIRGKGALPPVGSSDWIQQERRQLSQFHDQELEDFAFSLRNESDWLNEHMADIFSNTQLYGNALRIMIKLTGLQKCSRDFQNTRKVTRENTTN
jgi:hypothetical protein